MVEKTTSQELKKLSIEAGTYQLSATAISTGLEESDYSNEETYVKSEDLLYELSPNEDYYIVVGYFSDSVNIVIPSTWNDGINGEKPVKEIAESAFAESDIESVEIPNTMRTIGNFAFYLCTKLKDVTFKYRIPSVVYFYNELGWKDVYCSKGTLIDMGNNMFKVVGTNTSSKSLYFGGKSGILYTDDVRTEDFKFWHGSCWNNSIDKNEDGFYKIQLYEYESPELSDYCTIGANAFSYTGLTHLQIDSPIGIIGDGAFEYCSNLNSVTLDKNSGLHTIGNNAFYKCTGLSTFELGNTVRTIGNDTFESSGNGIRFHFYSVDNNIKNQLKHIGKRAFRYCEELIFKGILSDSEYEENIFPNLEVIGDYAFKGCYDAYYDISFLPAFIFPKTMKEVGIGVFQDCTGLGAVTFESPYGWNYFNSQGDNSFIDPETFEDPSALAVLMSMTGSISGGTSGTTDPNSENIFDYIWYKIFEMPAPEIDIIDNSIMNIKDSTGIAEKFKIFARKEGSETRVEVAIVNAVSEADFQ